MALHFHIIMPSIALFMLQQSEPQGNENLLRERIKEYLSG